MSKFVMIIFGASGDLTKTQTDAGTLLALQG